MAKKIAKKKTPDKKAKKPIKKAAAPKKAAKPAKKAAPKAAAKPAKKAAAPKKPIKAPKVVAKAPAAKKAAEKPVDKIAKGKAEKAPKVAKGRVAEPVDEAQVAEAEGDEEPEEIVLTDAEGRRYCRVKDCDQLASVDVYCRYHYLLFWKKIQIRKKILSEGKLERYIEDLTARYPDKFLDMLRKDLRSEKEFLGAIQELEIDESAVDSEFEDEAQTYIDEVRGMGEGGGGAREEEDF